MPRRSIAQIIDNQLRRLDPAGNELPPLPLGGDAWHGWLNARDTRSFTYRTPYGTLTARRELRHDIWYWYGYHYYNAKLHKIYLGKAEDITIFRLDEAVRKLARHQLSLSDFSESRPHKYSSVQAMPLLRTKLAVPAPPPHVISRPRLLHLLQSSANRTLTLLNAPAGSGKTTLLSEWTHYSPWPVAWLSLHEQDNDPHSFLSYLIAALQPFCPSIASEGLDQPILQPFTLLEVLSSLINELASLTGDITLILDNYHIIKHNVIHDGLKFLLDNLPPRVHLMISTRSLLPFSLVRLYAGGQVIELRARALRFTVEETSAFLAASAKELTSEEIAHLDHQVEGWAAGLQMATLALPSGDISPSIYSISGDNRYIQAYLVEEVLHQQPEHLQLFLLYTSLLDRFNSSLCSAVTGQADAPAYLEQLEQDNLFISQLDEQRGWYRYHRLFAETLRHYLERAQPDLVPRLHLQASQWFEQHGDIEQAIDHSLAAQDYQRAAVLIEQVAHALLGNGETMALQRWLEALPTDVIRTSPRLCITSAWLLFLTTQANPFIYWLDAAEEALNAGEETISPEVAATLQSEIVALRSVQHIHFNDFGRVVAACNRLLPSLPPENSYARSLLLLMLGMAYQRGVNVAAAAQTLSEASNLSQTGRHALLIPYVMISQAELYELQGAPFQSLKLYQQVLKLTNGQPGHPSGISAATMGYLFLEWQNLEMARKYLLQAWNIGQEIRNSNVICNAAFFLALTAQIQGYPHEANSWQQRLETYMQEVGTFDGIESVTALRALLALEQGRLEDALLWAQRRLSYSEETAPLHDDTEDIILARILIAAGRTYADASYLRRAQVLLDHMRTTAESIGKTKMRIEVLTLQALLFHHQEDIPKALAVLERALILAEPGRYVRVFVDKGDPMAMLLRQLRDHYKARKTEKRSLNLAYVRKLISAFTQSATQAAQPSNLLMLPSEDLPMLEPLSLREQEVLRLMATGRKNQEIARELVIVTGTVKAHINSIYRKLAVNSRVQALARARTLHLL